MNLLAEQQVEGLTFALDSLPLVSGRGRWSAGGLEVLLCLK